MEEAFLHFVWQHGLFDTRNLTSVTGKKFDIVNRGELNNNEGPDFEKCQIFQNGNNWFGNVEIHIKSSDWTAHQHQLDFRYNTTILHVVYEFDKDAYRQDGTRLPCVELKSRIAPDLLDKYKDLKQTLSKIPCASHKNQVSESVWKQAVGAGLEARLRQKANEILATAAKSTYNWDQIMYVLLAKTMGGKVNAPAMEQLANDTPWETVRKVRTATQLEALFFGQSGLLQDRNSDEYSKKLWQEYNFLKHKFNLRPMGIINWKFLRMHPPGFPTVRIAQFAALLLHDGVGFGSFLSQVNRGKFNDLQVSASEYWETHYRFGVATQVKSPNLGDDMMNRIYINAVLPCLLAYSIYRSDAALEKQIFRMLRSIPAENNAFTRQWAQFGIEMKSAYETQGILGLQQQFCDSRRCFQCPAGKQIFSGNNS